MRTIKHIFLVQFLRGIWQNSHNFCIGVCNLLIVVNVGGGLLVPQSLLFLVYLCFIISINFAPGEKNCPPSTEFYFPPSSPYLPLWFPPLVGLFPF